jgi:hydrogenase maturation factor HypF (carbamoyltransferase family)
MNYVVKCDECRRTFKETNNMIESVQGGFCSSCKSKISLFNAINKKDKKLVNYIMKDMKSGKVTRII